MFFRQNFSAYFFSILILIFAGFFLVNKEAKAGDWFEPIAPPSALTGGNLASPLNASSVAQTKLGSLTLGDTANPGLLTLTPGTFTVPGNTCTEGQLAYRQTDQKYYYCLGTGWNVLGGGTIFDLNTCDPAIGSDLPCPTPQTGWGFIRVNSYNNTQDAQYALKGQARVTVPGYGVQGVAGFDNIKSRGIYGFDSDHPSAYAGAFKGGVRIEKNPANPTTLTVGTSAEPVWLCINTDCRKTWPGGVGTDYFWLDNGPQVYLADTSPNQFVLGGASESEARFFVRTGEQKGVVIGQAIAINPYTCGDGICQAQEGNNLDPIRVPPATVACPQDCPPKFSFGPVHENVTANSANIRWTADEPHKGRVYYDTVEHVLLADYEFVDTPGDPAATFTAQLAGLTANTRYYYRVFIEDWGQPGGVWTSYGNTNVSPAGVYFETIALPSCGDGFCLGSERCATCYQDCGAKYGLPGCTNPSKFWCWRETPADPPACVECRRGQDCPPGGVCCLPNHVCRKGSCGPGETPTPQN